MSFASRHQLTALDRALVHLLDERARLTREWAERDSTQDPTRDPIWGAFVDDLLARSDGDFPAVRLREVFAAVDAGCGEAARSVAGRAAARGAGSAARPEGGPR